MSIKITKENFYEKFLEFKEKLSQASNVSWDLEMTGIYIKGINDSITDTPQERYTKSKTVVDTFSPTQLGICLAFEGEPIKLECYSMLTSPSSGVLSFDRSALKFLRGNHFDFNMWADESIPYFIPKEPKALIDREANESEKICISRLMKQVEPLIDDYHMKAYEFNEYIPEEPYTTLLKRKPAPIAALDAGFIFHSDAQFPRFIHNDINEYISKKYPSSTLTADHFVFDMPADGMKRAITIKIFDDTAKAALFSDIKELSNNPLFAPNVYPFIMAIAESRKPLIGHNSYMDLLFVCRHYLWGYLPESWEQFKTMVHEIFPIIYDTKYMAEQLVDLEFGWNNSSLSSLFFVLTCKEWSELTQARLDMSAFTDGAHSFKEASILVQENREQENAHDAGVDALMTSAIFHRLLFYYAERNISSPIVNYHPYRLTKHALRYDNNDNISSEFLSCEFKVTLKTEVDKQYVKGLFKLPKCWVGVYYEGNNTYTVYIEDCDDRIKKFNQRQWAKLIALLQRESFKDTDSLLLALKDFKGKPFPICVKPLFPSQKVPYIYIFSGFAAAFLMSSQLLRYF